MPDDGLVICYPVVDEAVGPLSKILRDTLDRHVETSEELAKHLMRQAYLAGLRDGYIQGVTATKREVDHT